MPSAHTDLLGLTVRDVVSGFTGMVTSQTRYLFGCDRIQVTPRVGEDGKQGESAWCDVLQVEVVPHGPVCRPAVPPVVGG